MLISRLDEKLIRTQLATIGYDNLQREYKRF